jgi:acetyl esterase/lipase
MMSERDVLISKKVFPVWPGLAPNETQFNVGRDQMDEGGTFLLRTDVSAPEIVIYDFEDGVKRPTVMVCPGGGYEILAIAHEGSEIARWLNSLGYTAAVLHYRVPGKPDAAMADAQRALSLLRSHSDDFGIDPTRCGAIGFSAGGHLAARLAVAGKERSYEPVDAVDDHACAPDFAMLIYPGRLVDKITGKVRQDVSPNGDMPPIFQAQTEDDIHYCTTAYAAFLDEAGVKNSNKIYKTGGHGYGLRMSSVVPASKWPEDAAAWLKEITR